LTERLITITGKLNKQKLDYNIVASGSSGNAVRIENVMIDCGVPFKKLKDELYDVDILLLTHIHTDHINKTTLKKIKEMFPYITIVGNYEIAHHNDVDIICNTGYEFEVHGISFEPFEVVHDVVTYGFKWEMKGNKIIYATDTNNLDMIDKSERFDYMFIESNHDELKIERAKANRGYDPKISAMRHMSTQKSKEFYFVHRVDKDSVWCELHRSSKFY